VRDVKATRGDDALRVASAELIGVTATLSTGAPTSGAEIAFYATPYKGQEQLLGIKPVDATGRARLATGGLAARTTFVARYWGDDVNFPAKSRSRKALVAALIDGEMFGWYARDGDAYLFHQDDTCSSSNPDHCPLFAARVTPNHSGSDVEVIGQVETDWGWSSGFDTFVPLDGDSQVAIALLGTQAGHSYRVRAIFPGDKDHLGNETPWLVFRVTT
jgi:hypothetical protein